MTPQLEHEYLEFVNQLGLQRANVGDINDPHTNEMSFCLLHMITGACTEVGEITELILNHIHYGNPFNVKKLCDEFGDLFFYLCGAIIEIESSIDEILDAMGGYQFPMLGDFVRNNTIAKQLSNGCHDEQMGRVSPRLLDATMSMVVSTSQMVDLLKKHMAYGRKLDFFKIRDGIGRTMVHLADACIELGTNFDEIIAMNMAKLKARYPNGYSHKSANNRDAGVETKAQHRAITKVVNVDGNIVQKGSVDDDRTWR